MPTFAAGISGNIKNVYEFCTVDANKVFYLLFHQSVAGFTVQSPDQVALSKCCFAKFRIQMEISSMGSLIAYLRWSATSGFCCCQQWKPEFELQSKSLICVLVTWARGIQETLDNLKSQKMKTINKRKCDFFWMAWISFEYSGSFQIDQISFQQKK